MPDDSSNSTFSLAKLLDKKTPLLDVLDIGAMIEENPRWSTVFHAGNAQLILVEPNEKEAERLQKAIGDDARWLNCYLGDGNSATLHMTHYPGCASFFSPDPNIIDKFISIDTGSGSNFHVTETQFVKTTRLDDVSPSIAVDFIKIDVQGSELKILENGIETLSKVSVVEAEVEFIPVYRDQPLFGELQVFMRSQGFVLHKLIDVASRCFRPLYFDENVTSGMSQMLWADAIFIRDFTNLGLYTDEGLLKTAYIMHDIYGSFDFVYVLLNEFDKRQGTSFSGPYANELAKFSKLPKFMLNMKELN